MEVYRDPEADGRCPAHPKPHLPDRCAGPNPFPDALQMVEDDAGNKASYMKPSYLVSSFFIVSIRVLVHF